MTSVPLELLGDYRIIKHMGQGPLGKLYLAEHRFMKKQYVLKILPEELTNDHSFLQPFEEEVAKLATLDHPHLVKIHNVSSANGLYFLVCDCVVDSIGETTNLAQYMAGRKEKLREEELLSLLKQVAGALDYLHEKGLSHLSLKLNNILVGKGKPGIDVFLSDIALAKLLSPLALVSRTYKVIADSLEVVASDTKGGEERYLSHPLKGEKLSKLSSSFLQSFAFLAPEQKLHHTGSVASDVYAFGVLAYYLIAGQFPEGHFPLPSSLTRDYQYDWDDLVLKCLTYAADLRPLRLMPLLEKEKKEVVLRPVLAGTQREKGEAASLLREKLGHKKEEAISTGLRPLIQRAEMRQGSAFAASAPTATLVEKKDLTEATAEPFTPPSMLARNLGLDKDPIVKEYQPHPKELPTIEPVDSDMVIIPAGRYMRGSSDGSRDETPCHLVDLSAFAMDIHPVTNEQFVRFLEYMGGEKDEQYNDLIRLKESRISRLAGRLSLEPGYAKHPVVGVTWYGAVAYAKWVGKRLPTEAEWEVAARGGLENMAYPTGENIERGQANFFSSDTTSVMSFAVNGYGLYDMAGNVYEWCYDWYGYNYYETTAAEPHNPKGPVQGVYRVLRGGCWKSLKEDLRCSHRHRNNPGTVNGTTGFRCAADVQEI